MNTTRFYTAFLLCALVFISCKNDAANKVEAENNTIENTNAKKEPVQRAKPLTKDQRLAANSLQRKIMQTSETREFTRALVTAGMFEEISDLENKYTILAAHNNAFLSLDPGQNVVTDPGRKDELIALLSNHIIKGSISSADMVQEIKKNSKLVLTTINDKKLTATMKNDLIIISTADASNSVTLGKSDIQGTNGMLHVVDALLR